MDYTSDIDVNNMPEGNFDDSSSGENSSEKQTTNCKGKPRKGKRKSHPENHEANSNKRIKEEIKSFKGKAKKDGKWQLKAEQKARKLKPSCKCEQSGNGSCSKLSEEHREYIFNTFWSKSWEERRKLIQTYVRTDEALDTSNRKRLKNSMIYQLPDEKGDLKLVCKNQFWNTLDIGANMVANMLVKEKDEKKSM
uniref:Uncharacterized protein n=2 Tax=Lutzomyia longipalpis TaxID=7200 RepID=A0A1B0CAG1_LUTLO